MSEKITGIQASIGRTAIPATMPDTEVLLHWTPLIDGLQDEEHLEIVQEIVQEIIGLERGPETGHGIEQEIDPEIDLITEGLMMMSGQRDRSVTPTAMTHQPGH
jgi:hypothetical protein